MRTRAQADAATRQRGLAAASLRMRSMAASTSVHFPVRECETHDMSCENAAIGASGAEHIVKRVRQWLPDITIVARARDADHAARLYQAGATDAVPETLESSLQLSEAVLVDLGVAMGPVIASIHEKRDEFRRQIKEAGGLDEAPKLKLTS